MPQPNPTAPDLALEPAPATPAEAEPARRRFARDWHRLGIVAKLTLAVGLTLVAALLATALINALQARHASLAQNEAAVATLTETAVHGLRTIMLGGYADIAQAYADNLKTIPGVIDFRIMRTSGVEAFRDNRTIGQVNTRLGAEEFFPREEETVIPVLDAGDPQLGRALAEKRSIVYYGTSPDHDSVITILTPVPNREECGRCHGSDHAVRGVIKLTSHLDAVEMQVEQNMRTGAVIAVAGALLAMAVVTFLVRGISVPVVDASRTIQKAVRDDDLTLTLAVRGTRETTALARSFNAFTDNVRTIVDGISEYAGRVRSMSANVMEESESTRDNVRQQQEDLQTVAASMEQMLEMTEHMVEHAASAAASASAAEREAGEGRRVLDSAVESSLDASADLERAGELVQSLDRQCRDISTVIDTIDEIARQVTILSLNASIEASKAGAEGAGFAVVARAVRDLATRTHEATRSIHATIGALRENAEQAMTFTAGTAARTRERVDSARSAQASIDEMTAAVARITELNVRIERVASDQIGMARSIDEAMTRISGKAAETASSMDRVSERNRGLAQLAEAMGELVERFKTR